VQASELRRQADCDVRFVPQADIEAALAKLIGSLKAGLSNKNSTIIFKNSGTDSRHVFPG
jgi:hypothetical protein